MENTAITFEDLMDEYKKTLSQFADLATELYQYKKEYRYTKEDLRSAYECATDKDAPNSFSEWFEQNYKTP